LRFWSFEQIVRNRCLDNLHDGEQGHVDDGDLVVVAATFAAGGLVEAVRFVLTEADKLKL
jgi:hypothetical protein